MVKYSSKEWSKACAGIHIFQIVCNSHRLHGVLPLAVSQQPYGGQLVLEQTLNIQHCSCINTTADTLLVACYGTSVVRLQANPRKQYRIQDPPDRRARTLRVLTQGNRSCRLEISTNTYPKFIGLARLRGKVYQVRWLSLLSHALSDQVALCQEDVEMPASVRCEQKTCMWYNVHAAQRCDSVLYWPLDVQIDSKVKSTDRLAKAPSLPAAAKSLHRQTRLRAFKCCTSARRQRPTNDRCRSLLQHPVQDYPLND